MTIQLSVGLYILLPYAMQKKFRLLHQGVVCFKSIVYVFHVACQPMTPKLLLLAGVPAAVCPETEGARAQAHFKPDFPAASASLKQQRHHHNNTRTCTCLVRSHREARLHLIPPRSSDSPINHNITTSAFARRISISIRTQSTPPSLNTYRLHLHSSSPSATCCSPPLTPSIHDELTAAD
jgi:hypothetical protein